MKYSDNDQSLIPLYNKVIPKLNGKFRAAQDFRPLRILVQIVSMQLAFWLTIFAVQLPLLTATTALLKRSGKLKMAVVLWPSFQLLFGLEMFSVQFVEGILNCVSFIISGFISAYHLKFIIKRSRLCLDFSLTCHLIHLIVVCLYNRQFPLNFVWWSVILVSAWLLTERSRSLCLKKELIPISLKQESPKIEEQQPQTTQKKQVTWFNRLFRLFYWRKYKRTSNSTVDIYSSKSPLKN